MNGKNGFDGLHFHNHGVVYHEVDSIRDADLDAFAGDRKQFLRLDYAAGASKLVNETGSVGTFEQPGSESAVNLESGSEDTDRGSSMKKFATSVGGLHFQILRSVDFRGVRKRKANADGGAVVSTENRPKHSASSVARIRLGVLSGREVDLHHRGMRQ
jgi:hypothetical protein